MPDRADYYVVGIRASGERLVLAECASAEGAEFRAERFRRHLVGYASITVEYAQSLAAGDRRRRALPTCRP